MKRWEHFTEEELKKFFEESKTTTEFAEKIGYKDRHVVDDIRKKYPWCSFSERNNLLNKKFGRLTVIKKEGSKNGKILWTAKCDCGNIVQHLKTETLKSGHTQSCGCLWLDIMHTQAGIQKADKNKEGLVGKQFHYLTVLPGIKYINNQPYNTCKCKCGNITYVRTGDLTTENTTSCGCYNKERIRETNSCMYIIGQKFGKLTVISATEHRKQRRIQYLCKCDCGNYKEVDAQRLKAGRVLSCGCLGRSRNEYIIQDILKKNNIDFKEQYIFSDLIGESAPLRFDFAIFKNDKVCCLIEYNGLQHYEPVEYFGGEERFQQQLMYDEKKKEYCLKNNIPLIIINYSQEKLLNEKFLLNKLEGYI